MFPQGFTVDRIPGGPAHQPFLLALSRSGWDYIPPTPANGPIPAVPGGFGLTRLLFSLHPQRRHRPHQHPDHHRCGCAKSLLTVTPRGRPLYCPDIPIPAINLGLDGNVNVSFNAPATTLLSGLGRAIDISGIQITNI